jgi:hypothetical protein
MNSTEIMAIHMNISDFPEPAAGYIRVATDASAGQSINKNT